MKSDRYSNCREWPDELQICVASSEESLYPHRMPETPSRRDFLKSSALTVAASATGTAVAQQSIGSSVVVDNFKRADSLFHGEGWETLNPGYWQIKDQTLRRRIKNVGDRARATGFPYHYETHSRSGGKMPVEYDPSLPVGILWRRDWKVSGSYSVRIAGTYHADRAEPEAGDDASWKMNQPGHGMLGIAFGGKSLFESFTKVRNATIAAWTDDGTLRFDSRNKSDPKIVTNGPVLKPGDSFEMMITVTTNEGKSDVEVSFVSGGNTLKISRKGFAEKRTEGYVGIAGRGTMDFSIDQFEVTPLGNQADEVGEVNCYTCYPLGDTLREVDGEWRVKFVGIFASDGETAEIRVSDQENPQGGWEAVPVAGTAKIVNNEWRRFTAILDTPLPGNPADHTYYYTVWKDGVNVTADPRIGSAGSGPGTGMVGDVPVTGGYVGRLPQLRAPYKMAGLSCHAITSGLQQRNEAGELKMLGGGDDWQVRDQPTVGAYKHLEEYDFQIMVWEDDVWYMELVLYPPSTDDAFKVVTTSICGPTSRWQMMRHWNVINPGDHDYGMDDIKGPEQLILRQKEGLGQDRDYLRRNFQIVHHLVTGDEEVDGTINPKKWRAWKMPDRDFTLAICDSRLWRSSQDTDIWVNQGWGDFRSLYDRTDPTRSLLGEEQFAWLQELIRTDTSLQICLTGVNGLHTIWTGAKWKGANSPFQNEMNFHQRDRVTADYAGWVKAGADRVLELLGERDGVVTVYGDVHNGCIMKNDEHRVIECSFGPIGRSGGRSLIPGFGRQMKDVDGRDLKVHALYHKEFDSPDQDPHPKGAPFYWNFLEMEFDPRASEDKIAMRIRNMIDAPSEKPRGGGELTEKTAASGRELTCKIDLVTTLPNADVRFSHAKTGKPIRGSRSREDGTVPVTGFVGIEAGETVLMTAFDGSTSDAQSLVTS